MFYISHIVDTNNLVLQFNKLRYDITMRIFMIIERSYFMLQF